MYTQDTYDVYSDTSHQRDLLNFSSSSIGDLLSQSSSAATKITPSGNFDTDDQMYITMKKGSWVNNAIIQDRIFWIYFIVTLFFIIIGVGSIITSTDPYILVIAILWLLSNVALMIVVYHASLTWGPTDEEDSLICVVDANSACFEPNNRIWLLINILFVVLLIISVLWAGEISNPDAGPLRAMSGVLILLGGLILCALATPLSRSYMIPFWVSLGYLVIWFGLTLYIII